MRVSWKLSFSGSLLMATTLAFRSKVVAHRLIDLQVNGNHFRHIDGVGSWGGLCTCPDGSRYDVGDNHDECQSIFCEGGVAGPCSEGGISPVYSGFGVTCAPAVAHHSKSIWERYEDAANILQEHTDSHSIMEGEDLEILDEVRFEEHPSSGWVESVFSFGSPAIAKLPPTNARSPDGCFKGLRTVLDGRDPVPWFAQYAGFRHPMMEMFALPPKGNSDGVVTHACRQNTTWMPTGSFRALASMGSWTHRQTVYWDRLREIGVKNETDHGMFARFSKSVSKTPAVAHEWATLIGWNLVSWANLDSDPVHLYQEPHTHRCAIAFRGSDDPFQRDGMSDWSQNFRVYEREFCNFDRVHGGFVEEWESIVGTSDFQDNIRSQLKHCSEVSTGGHSSGGAMAELFAACANGGTPEPVCNETAWPDLEHGLVCGGCKVLVNENVAHYNETCSTYCQAVDLECMAAWQADGDTCGIEAIIPCDQMLLARDVICRCGPDATHPDYTPSLAEASDAEQERWLTWFRHYSKVSWSPGRPQQIERMKMPPL